MKCFLKALFTFFMLYVSMMVAISFVLYENDVEEYKKQKAMHLTCVAKGLQHCPSMPKLTDYNLTERDVN